MVSCQLHLSELALQLPLLLAQAGEKPPILQMPASTRARVMAVLVGLIILGVAMMLLAWMGARMTRRYMNRGADQRVIKTPQPDDWAKTPLSPEGKSGMHDHDRADP